VSWAGDPAKGVSEDGTLHPRYSFLAWKEVVHARSRPWLPGEVDAAEDLRRRAIEVDLGNQIARAEQAVRVRDDVVAVVSHDLKNPLQVIGMSAAVLRGRVAGDARAAELVATTERAVARMNGLIHDLLDLAQIESGRFDLAPSPCAASRLVADAVAMLAPIAEAKGVRLAWRGDGEAWVLADAERVFQVLSNLLGNAIKFTPAGGSVTVGLHAEPAAVRFAVRDTGPGIPAIELAHVFDRYWQARRGRSAGSGLGLYIAKGIVDAHGGRLWAESVVGAGATFSFTLPPHAPEGA
jgi:chemotaxis family two-component system sensor kinase Cph1